MGQGGANRWGKEGCCILRLVLLERWCLSVVVSPLICPRVADMRGHILCSVLVMALLQQVIFSEICDVEN